MADVESTKSDAIELDIIELSPKELECLLESNFKISEVSLAAVVTPKALRSAVKAENTKLARLLLRNGADPCAKDAGGYNSLHAAASTGNPDLVRLIASSVDDVDELTDDLGLSALHIATFCNHYHYTAHLYTPGYRPIVEDRFVAAIYQLLRHGADPNVFSRSGWTPLHIVARSCAHLTRSLDIARMLVRYGAHVGVLDDFNFSPLYHALIASNVHMAEYFVDVVGGLCEEEEDKMMYYEHFLFEAFCRECEGLVDYLLDRGARMDLVDDRGRSLLRRALKRLKNEERCLSVVKLMLQKGARLLECDRVGIDRDRLGRVELLLREIEAMKLAEVSDEFRTTYYDVFSRRNDDLARVLRPRSVRDALEVGCHAFIFVHFSDRIESAYARGSERLRELNRLQNVLWELWHRVLPVEVVLMICEYLRPSDICAL